MRPANSSDPNCLASFNEPINSMNWNKLWDTKRMSASISFACIRWWIYALEYRLSLHAGHLHPLHNGEESREYFSASATSKHLFSSRSSPEWLKTNALCEQPHIIGRADPIMLAPPSAAINTCLKLEVARTIFGLEWNLCAHCHSASFWSFSSWRWKETKAIPSI